MEQLLTKLDRKPGSHKAENGCVGIIGGSVDYTGAPALAGKAALRTGCDLVEVLTSSEVSDTVASYSENLIVGSYESKYFNEGAVEAALEVSGWADAVVIGPGLGDPEASAIRSFVSETDTPLVVDADAIQPALETEITEAVFTPHQREAEDIEESYGSVQDFVSETGSIVVLKGNVDQVFVRGGKFRNTSGTPAMTVGGTGDTMTGIIASLISQGLELDEAARLGTWINGKAGGLATEEYGNGMLATDLIEKIPEAVRE